MPRTGIDKASLPRSPSPTPRGGPFRVGLLAVALVAVALAASACERDAASDRPDAARGEGAPTGSAAMLPQPTGAASDAPTAAPSGSAAPGALAGRWEGTYDA